ncbi:MAG TPA: hypothetical protein VMV49_01010, partial [Candidatus Deferrimicrobium sp.]|nr:hypothetical protein [Candidatus Deferrimicrobium sp.]
PLLNDSWVITSTPITGTLPASWVARFPDGRIDHIFVSPGTTILTCKYFGGSNSDHPAVVAEIQL